MNIQKSTSNNKNSLQTFSKETTAPERTITGKAARTNLILKEIENEMRRIRQGRYRRLYVGP